MFRICATSVLGNPKRTVLRGCVCHDCYTLGLANYLLQGRRWINVVRVLDGCGMDVDCHPIHQ